MAIAIISGSSRDGGNTETLAGIATKDLSLTWFRLRQYHIRPILDQRHAPQGFDPVDDDYHTLMRDLLTFDVWLFASPVYWYGFSGLMKNFIDRWSEVMRRPHFAFGEEVKQKRAGLVLVGGDHPHLKALALVQQFYWICDFVHMPFIGYAIGEANRPGDVVHDDRGIASAASLNETLQALHRK